MLTRKEQPKINHFTEYSICRISKNSNGDLGVISSFPQNQKYTLHMYTQTGQTNHKENEERGNETFM